MKRKKKLDREKSFIRMGMSPKKAKEREEWIKKIEQAEVVSVETRDKDGNWVKITSFENKKG